jgi:hypothetical protein
VSSANTPRHVDGSLSRSSRYFIRLALPSPHACLSPFCWAFSFSNYTSHASAKAFLASSVSLSLGTRRRSLEIAACSAIVLSATLGRQPCAPRRRQLLASTNG